jgi:60 kDa SS-A/Ro ribonucleoprotein
MSYTKHYNPNKTPQVEQARSDQIKNAAGGYVFQITPLHRLERFLILGSEAPTYYASARTLTRENAQNVEQCWSIDPQKTADTIVAVVSENRAPRMDPALFALALGVVHPDLAARQAAYRTVISVCRIPTHLFTWMKYCQDLGKGNGRGMKRTIASWYDARSTPDLAYAMVKYQDRAGYNHKRLIDKSNKSAGEDVSRKALYNWACGREFNYFDLPQVVNAFRKVIASTNKADWIDAVKLHGLPWEALPTQALKEPEVWEALAPNMGMTALIRNLGNMTKVGAIGPMKPLNAVVAKRLTNEEVLHKARIHPFNVLLAFDTYAAGKGFRGSGAWTPETKVINALDEAFYKAFKNVEPTGQRILIAIDVSASMSWSSLMNTNLKPMDGAAAIAMVIEKTEPNAIVTVFDTKLSQVDLSSHQRLDDVKRAIFRHGGGGTDCAQPMIHALKNNIAVDTFIILTDNETWAGRSGHPFQALQEYRNKMNIPRAKLVTIGMTATESSIADPNDPGMLDIVGFDASIPAILRDFMTRDYKQSNISDL